MFTPTRTTLSMLLVMGFATFAVAAMLGTPSKIPSLHSHGFSAVDAHTELPAPALAVGADHKQLLQTNAWTQYRAEVMACSKEAISYQDACLQQARRERKQNSGLPRKSHSVKPKLANTKIASAK